MLNIKKTITLLLIALAALTCLTSARIRQAKMICDAGCIKTSQCFEKGGNFSIVNIFSLQFR